MRYRLTVIVLAAVLLGLLVTTTRTEGQSIPGSDPRIKFPFRIVVISNVDKLSLDGNSLAELFSWIDSVREPGEKAGYSVHFSSLTPQASEEQALPMQSGNVVLSISLIHNENQPPEKVDEVAKAITKQMQRVLNELGRPQLSEQSNRHSLIAEILESSERDIKKLQQELDNLHQDLMKRGLATSPEAIDQMRQELYHQRMMLMIEREGLTARRGAIVREIAKADERHTKQQKKEPDFELQKLKASLDACKNNYIRLKKANEVQPGVVPQQDIENAHLEITRLEYDIQAHIHANAQQPRNEWIEGLTRQLSEIDIERATVTSKHHLVSELFRELDSIDAHKAAQKMREIRNKIELLREQQRIAYQRLLELTPAIEVQRPKATLLSNLNAKKPKEKKGSKKDNQ